MYKTQIMMLIGFLLMFFLFFLGRYCDDWNRKNKQGKNLLLFVDERIKTFSENTRLWKCVLCVAKCFCIPTYTRHIWSYTKKDQTTAYIAGNVSQKKQSGINIKQNVNTNQQVHSSFYFFSKKYSTYITLNNMRFTSSSKIN